MPSSTSSSNANHRAPSLPPAKVWAVTLAIFGVLLGSSEVLWRVQGHLPSVEDDPALWAAQRDALAEADDPVALVGASRLQLGFAPKVWRDIYPEREPFVLTVKGKSPMSTFEDLAQDPSFNGLAIVSLSEEMFEPYRWNDQAGYVDYYRDEYKIGAAIESRLETFAESHLVSMSYTTNIEKTVTSLVEEGHLQHPHFIRMFTNRSRVADFSVLGDELDEHRHRREERMRAGMKEAPLGSVQQWREQIPKVRKLAEALQARGGQVVFVKLPVTGVYREVSREYYPRNKYWDVFAAEVGAPAVHFEDVPALSRLECPDSSHIDKSDRATLTRALIEELVRLGVIQPAP